jgi:dolichyl-phosphate beta-glucosyltransferase
MSVSTPELSVVLPSFRGAKSAKAELPVLLDFLRSLRRSHEVIIVDDGSVDDGATARVATEFGCRFLENPTNQGKGASVRRGMLAAKGRLRMFTDIDVPYEAESMARALYYLDARGFHMVAGDRRLPSSSYFTQVSGLRRFSSVVYSNVVGRLVAGGWYDTQCGLKGFRGDVADDLFSVGIVDRFAFDVELFYVALKRNYDIKRIPVRLRKNDSSTVRVLRDGLAMVRDLGRVLAHQALGRYKGPHQQILEDHDGAAVQAWQARNLETHDDG